jgi:mRNA interferase RelE/StbE
MDWKIEFTKQSQKKFNSLDSSVKLRIKKYILEKLIINPKLYLIPLLGDKSGFYKFRVGDYRLLCVREDLKYIITVVKVKHRKEVYK